MNNIHLLIVVCQLAFEFSLVNAQGCSQTGWFGHKCQYQCHCENDKCNSSTGQCTENTKCVKGWFGLACQYQDLTSVPSATITSYPLQTSNTWITDGDDSTCNQDNSLNSVVVAWNITYPFSWLRLTVKDNEYPGNFKVSFREGVNDSKYIKFQNHRIFVINANTVDISCQMTVDVMKIIISGHSVTSLCSVYISGGRNAAVKQTAVQSSTYTDKRGIQAKASNAVDGDTSSFFKKKTCTHTNIVDSSPKWNVTFNQAHAINRIVLYNRFDSQDQCCPKRLVNFSLQTFNSSYISNFSFQDSGKDPMLIYTVIVPVSQRNLPINVIGIRAYSRERILSLCEVQAFEGKTKS
ncbi:unnamed protein product [Lymnaea stagnalis]|uniref:Fucolectin tachylectin-4 pentraxin-1 domain-containing protein n=1 Tax=Lymnaea stagnalis TaxID=6523 RepID=A0AAV2HL35_LYMST